MIALAPPPPPPSHRRAAKLLANQMLAQATMEVAAERIARALFATAVWEVANTNR